MHGDHTFGVPLYYHAFWTAKVAGKSIPEKLNIWAQKEVFEQTLQISKTLFPYQINTLEKMTKINNIDISTKTTFELNDCKLTPIPLQHVIPTYGYRIDATNPSFSMAYVPDTRPFENLIGLVKNVDVLIHEAFCTENMRDFAILTKHSTAKEAAELAEKANAKKLVLIHILPAFNGREKEIIDEASSVFNGEIIVPTDFDILKF
jgi:ribonuclease Z